MATLPEQDETLRQAGSTHGAGWTPLCPGVMLQAAAAVPDLCQHGQKEAHSWQALSAIHLGKRQVLSSDLIGNRQPSPNCALQLVRVH